jgi:hypothetical protein
MSARRTDLEHGSIVRGAPSDLRRRNRRGSPKENDGADDGTGTAANGGFARQCREPQSLATPIDLDASRDPSSDATLDSDSSNSNTRPDR